MLGSTKASRRLCRGLPAASLVLARGVGATAARFHTRSTLRLAAATAAAPNAAPATATATATASASAPASGQCYVWGGGRDLRSALSGGAWGTGGLTRKQDPTFSLRPKAYAPRSQLADGQTDVPELAIRQIAFGVQHVGLLSHSGAVYMTGLNKTHCLGVDSSSHPLVRTPMRVDGLPPIKQLALGLHHTVALAEDGGVWTWGRGGGTLSVGALGHGDTTDQSSPKQITVGGFDGKKIVGVAAGHNHTVALDDSGQLFAWGQGDFGRLGTGGSGSAKAPTHLASLHRVKISRVVCGPSFNAAISDQGHLYTWGKNDAGQLGLKPGALATDVYNMETQPMLVEALAFRDPQEIVDVACGDRHMLVATRSQRIYHWGYTRNPEPVRLTGQSGKGSGGEGRFAKFRFTHVAAGSNFSACIDALGNVYSWGSSSSYCLGHEDSDRWYNRYFGQTDEPRRVHGFGPAHNSKGEPTGNRFGPARSITANFRKIAVQT